MAVSPISPSSSVEHSPTPAPRRVARPAKKVDVGNVAVNLVVWGLSLAVLGPFLIYPVFKVLISALTIRDPITHAYTFHPEYLKLPMSDPRVREAIFNSFILGIASTIAATLIGLPLAYAGARLKFAGKGPLTGLLLVPLLLPPLVGAVGLKQMLAREGFINTLLGRNIPPNADPILFTDRSFLGGWGPLVLIVIVTALHLYPLIYLNVSAAWANVDSSLEEAAENMGAGTWRVFRTVTLPLLLPGYLSGALIVFIFAFTDLGTPLMFNYHEVAAVKIFDSKSSLNDPTGYVLGFYLVILAAAVFYVSRKFLDGGKIATLARGTRRAREQEPAKWAYPLLYGYFLLVIGLALLPHFGVVLASLGKSWISPNLWPEWSTENYHKIFRDSSVPTATSIKNSLLYATASMFLDVIAGFALAYALVRGKIWAKGVLDTLAMLPLALPGLILAFGIYIAYMGPATNPVPFLIIAYAIRRLPYALRSISGGLQQMSVTLEEASLNMGASPIATVWNVTRPLVTANLIAAGLLTFAFAVLEVSDSLILAQTPQSTPIARAIYMLTTGSRLYEACALGVVGMVMLTATFLVVNKLLGKQMGALFRA